MGIDITVKLERMVPGGWAVIEGMPDGMCSFDARNYALFDALAGVRGDAGPIAPPRGLPGDASRDVSDEFAMHDNHTASWYALRELFDAVHTHPVVLGLLCDTLSVAAYCGVCAYSIRVVFWFDS